VTVALICVAVVLLAAPGARAASSLTWSGSDLIDHSPPFATTTEMTGVACPTVALCVAGDVGGNIVASTSPSTRGWTISNIDSGGSREDMSLACPNGSLCIAADSLSGQIAASTDPAGGAGSWTPVFQHAGVTGVSCASTTMCVAVDSAGNVITSTNPTASGSSGWTVTAIPGISQFSAISCVAGPVCVAASGPALVVSTNPTGGASAWSVDQISGLTYGIASVSCMSASLCVGVSGGTIISTQDPTGGSGAWSTVELPTLTEPLTGISCASGPVCVAVGGSGEIATTTTPTGGVSAWTVGEMPTENAFSGVSCASPSLCVAVDQNGDAVTSTDPAARAASFTSIQVDGSTELTDVACAPAGLCVAADNWGQVATTSDPTEPDGWAISYLGLALTDLSCPAAEFCAALNGAGNVVTTTDPTGGFTAWDSTDVSGASQLNGLSCASPTLCVAVGSDGTIATSIDPTAGPSAWELTSIGDEDLSSVSCPSSSLCVAVDSDGDAVTTVDPTGGASSWTVTRISGTPSDGVPVSTVACSAAGLCAAGDQFGDLFSTSDPTAGSGAWAETTVASYLVAIDTVACAPDYCVAVNDYGGEYDEYDGGWAGADIDTGGPFPTGLSGVACEADSVCVAVDTNGAALFGLPVPPESTAPPTIDGGSTVGDTLIEAHGTWQPSPTGYAYQWERCATAATCTPIAGATGQSYVLTSADVGDVVRVEETASDTGGAGTPQPSAATPTVTGVPTGTTGTTKAVFSPGPSLIAAPEVTGSVRVGSTLSASTGTWNAAKPLITVYQWERCATSCAPVAGATRSTYTVTPSEIGFRLRVAVLVGDTTGVGAAFSATTGPVAPAAAEILKSLRALDSAGARARLRTLRRTGRYEAMFDAPSSGRLTVTWSTGGVTVAKGQSSFAGAARGRLKVTVSAAGKRALKRRTSLTERLTFTPTGATATALSRRLANA
jgi:hypothetical protein